MRHGNYSDTQGKSINWSMVKLIWPYLTDYRARICAALSCLILAKLASIAGPFLLKATVDTLNTTANLTHSWAIAPAGLVIAYGMARFSNVLLGEIRDTLFGRVTERAMRKIGLRVFQHLHSLDLDFHLNRRTGGLSRDIERGTTGISFLMRFLVFNIAPTFVEIALVVGILLINYGISFALITLVSIIAYIAFSVVATEWRTRFIREANMADSASNTRAVDSLLNYETVKYFTNEEFEAKRYDTELENWEQAKRKNRLSLFALNCGQAGIISFAMTASMWLAVKQVNSANMTIGDFVLINAFMMQLFMPLNFLGFVYREIKGSMANIEKMFDLLAVTPTIRDTHNAPELQLVHGAIEFKQVKFSYNPERVILNDVSFTIAPGEKVAVVGASGAGKSTLIKLLFRFYDTDSGTIYIDNQPINNVTQHSLRQAIGIVPQDTVLFNDSIFENIRYGKPEASDQEVQKAIDLANLRAFIDLLPKGQNTIVGERGLKLSGGEKQRVAIARTLLKQPGILVFDEATSSLDSHSEQAILEALGNISLDHTSLVIAHRLSTVVDADNIIVLGNGKILEQGTHEQLLAHSGHYALLWKTQRHTP